MNTLDTYHIYKHAWVYCGPAYSEKQLSANEVKPLLKSGGWMLRNSYDFDCPTVTKFWYLVRDNYGGIESFPKQTKNRIKKALLCYEIALISKERMQAEGYNVYLTAFEHYSIQNWKQSKEEFLQSLENPNYDFWGVIYKETGQLAAWLICEKKDSIIVRVSSKTDPKYLSNNFPMFGLNYWICEYYLSECKQYKYISNGARSITEHSNIQNFLTEHFGYRKAYCHLKIYYKWWFGIIIKCLYPFRDIIKNNQIHAVLAMHEMQS